MADGRWDDIIDKHAKRAGIDPQWMRRIVKVESDGDPNQKTGSYKGLFQLSESEFKRHGGSGNIYDPEQNTMAAANKLAQESRDFKAKYGKDPGLADLYMIHQQGVGGYDAHTKNPDQPAWRSMWSTGEGQKKGEAWAKDAIWLNLPASVKAKVGGKENLDRLTSGEFKSIWANKIEGGTSTYAGTIGERPGGGGMADDKTENREAFLRGEAPKVERKQTILGEDFARMMQPTSIDIPQMTPRFSIR